MLQDLIEGVARHPLGYAFWASCIGMALVLGRAPERIAGAALLAYLAFAIAYHPNELHTVFWHVAAGDLFVLAVMLALLFRYGRRWLIPANGLAILSVAAHLPRLLGPLVRNLGYATVVAALGYALVATVAVGALLERRHALRTRRRDVSACRGPWGLGRPRGG